MTTITERTLDENFTFVNRSFNKVTASSIQELDESAISTLVGVQESLAAMVEQVRKEMPRNEDRKNLIKGLSIMHNHTSSVIDLASQREIDDDGIAEYLAKNQRRITKVASLISSLRKLKGKSSIEIKDETSESAAAADERGGDFKVAGDQISAYQSYRALLPKSGYETKKDFVLARVPVVVKTKPILTAEDFKKAGFVSKPIDGFYPVLEDQLVLGINTHLLRESGKNIKEFRKALVKIIPQKFKTRLVVMSDMNIGLGNSGFLYTWLMSEADYDRVVRASHKRFGVVEWGFAFRN